MPAITVCIWSNRRSLPCSSPRGTCGFWVTPDQALSHVSEALALARNLGQPYSIAFAHYMTSVVHLLRGEPERALASAEQSLEMSREQRFSLYVLLSAISRGRALGELGRVEEARSEIDLGLEQARACGRGLHASDDARLAGRGLRPVGRK